MTLSNKKRKLIKRCAQAMSSEEISQSLGIHLSDVQRVLGTASALSFTERVSAALPSALVWGLAFQCLLAPFVFIRNAYDFANLTQSVFIQLGALLLASAWCFAAALKGGAGPRFGPPALPLFVFLVWAGVSFLYAHNKWEGSGLLAHWWACGLVYLLVVNSVKGETDCRRLLAAITAAAAGTALLGILQYLTGFDWIPQAQFPAAVFANKNMAAHFMVLSLPVAAAMFITSRRPPAAWLFATAGALMLVFLFYTRTKAAWLALAVQLTLAAVLLLREKVRRTALTLPRFKYVAAAVCLGSATVMINTGPDGFGRGISSVISQMAPTVMDDQGRVTREIPYESKGVRLDIWRNTIEMIKERPVLGFGLGNHKVFYPAYHEKAVAEQIFSEAFQLHNVHNDFLQVLSEMGIPGILAVAWLALVFLRLVLRKTLASPQSPMRIETIALGMAAAGIAVNSFFCFPLERAVPPFILAVYMGIVPVLITDKAAEPKHFFSPRWIMFAAGIFFLVAFFPVASHYSRVIAADKHYLAFSELEKRASWNGVIHEAEKAYELDPRRLKTLSYMGRAYVESGKYNEGIEVLRKVVEAYPFHINALLNLGVALSALDRFDEALQVYQRVLSIKFNYAKAHNNIGNIYMRQHNAAQALESFRKAAELDPADALIHFNLGVAEIQGNDYSQAAEAFARAVELRPDWDLARKNLGIVYAQYLNRPEEALVELQKALELNPSMKDADQIKAIIDRLQAP